MFKFMTEVVLEQHTDDVRKWKKVSFIKRSKNGKRKSTMFLNWNKVQLDERRKDRKLELMRNHRIDAQQPCFDDIERNLHAHCHFICVHELDNLCEKEPDLHTRKKAEPALERVPEPEARKPTSCSRLTIKGFETSTSENRD